MQREVLRTCETSSGDKNSPPPRPAPRFFSSGIPPPLQKRMSLFCSHGFQDHRGQQTRNLLPPKPCPHNLLSSEILSRLPQRHFFLPGTGNQKSRFTTSTTAATTTLYCPPSHPATKKQNEKHSKPSSKQMYLQLHYCTKSTQGR